jgi:hypothetical protein
VTPKIESLVFIALGLIFALMAFTWFHVDDYKESTENERQALRDSLSLIFDRVSADSLKMVQIENRLDSVVAIKQRVKIRYEVKLDSVRSSDVAFADSIILSKIR